jgi:hypothetical protein
VSLVGTGRWSRTGLVNHSHVYFVKMVVGLLVSAVLLHHEPAFQNPKCKKTKENEKETESRITIDCHKGCNENNVATGLDVTELLETQKSLCLDLLSQAQLTDFVLACGAEDEDDDVAIDQVNFLGFASEARSKDFSRPRKLWI